MSRTTRHSWVSAAPHALAVLTFLFLPCRAQETGQITGRIVDSSGSVVPGAAAEVRNTNTNIKWDVASNSEGYYAQGSLPPADYRVTVHLKGFKQEVRGLTFPTFRTTPTSRRPEPAPSRS